jgi:hypothetical protein
MTHHPEPHIRRSVRVLRIVAELHRCGYQLGPACYRANGRRWWEGELHRVAGRLALARGERDESEMCFQKSMAISRTQGAKSLELRASHQPRPPLTRRGKCEEARELPWAKASG